jgi:preprotein translocase subunit SecD
LFYYRLLGLVTIASLVLSAVIVYACLVILGRQIGFTLSLAGIAGFIVAIGITADSFIIFFERLKDEVREGRSMRAAVPRAWVSARRTILSADAVSFLAAATLYVLAIGGVKGFAFTLGLATVLDLIVVFLFTHPLVALLSRNATFASPRVSGLGRLRVGPATSVVTAGGGAAAVRGKASVRGTSTNRGGS